MVECDPESGTVCFTRRAIHLQPRSRRLFLCTIYRNRARTSPGNVRIWGMREKMRDPLWAVSAPLTSKNAQRDKPVLEALAAEHQPRGPTEEHLVEEIAGIMWRKRRLRLAEAATIRRGLPDPTFPSCCHRTAEKAVAHLRASATGEELVEAVQATSEDTASDLTELAADEAQ